MRRPRNLVNFPRLVNLCMSSFLADHPLFRTSESKIMHFGSPRNLVNFPRLVSEQKLRCHIYRRQVRATLQVPLSMISFQCCTVFPCTCIRKYRVEGSQLSVHVNLLIGAVAKRRVVINTNYHATIKFKNNLK